MQKRTNESADCYNQLGSLGGGNHFIEIDESENGDIWLVIHTGSRRLGKSVCDYHTARTVDEIVSDTELAALVDRVVAGEHVEVPEHGYKRFRELHIQHIKNTFNKKDIQK